MIPAIANIGSRGNVFSEAEIAKLIAAYDPEIAAQWAMTPPPKTNGTGCSRKRSAAGHGKRPPNDQGEVLNPCLGTGISSFCFFGRHRSASLIRKNNTATRNARHMSVESEGSAAWPTWSSRR